MNATEEKITTAMWYDDRSYRIVEGGKEHFLISVSTKLGIEDKPFLLQWYADLGWDEARRRLHESAERGKRIHFAMWVYLNGGTVVFNPSHGSVFSEKDIIDFKAKGLFFDLKNQDEMVALWKIQKFFEITGAKAHETEKTVYSIGKRIAGTLDLVLEIETGAYDVNGRSRLTIPQTGKYVGDLKTGKVVPESAWPQVATYTEAYEEMSGKEIKGGIILHTESGNKGGIEGFGTQIKTREELKPYCDIYAHLAAVYDARNPNVHIKAFDFPTIITMKKDLG